MGSRREWLHSSNLWSAAPCVSTCTARVLPVSLLTFKFVLTDLNNGSTSSLRGWQFRSSLSLLFSQCKVDNSLAYLSLQFLFLLSVEPRNNLTTSTKNLLIPSQRLFLRTGQCCSSCFHLFRADSNSVSHLVWNFQTCVGKYRTSAWHLFPILCVSIWATEYPFISRKPWLWGKKSRSFNSTALSGKDLCKFLPRSPLHHQQLC